MRRGLQMVTAMELPADIVGALGAGIIGRDSLASLCELVAQRAREEMREAAAKVIDGYLTIGKDVSDEIRAIPTTPPADNADGTKGT